MEILQILLAFLLFLGASIAVFKGEKYVILIGFLLIILGQFGRLPIPLTDIGVLISDLLLPWIVFLWFTKTLVEKRSLPKSHFGKTLLLFLLVAILSLIVNLPAYSLSEILVSSFYLVRLIAYFLYFFICITAFQSKKTRFHFPRLLLTSTAIIAFLGILQFIFVPDFGFMTKYGWDPHIGRLFSTWFDPNFMAGFFAFVIGITMTVWLMNNVKKQSIITPILLAFIGVSFFLTFSRSGLLALGVVVSIIGILKYRVVLIVGAILGVIALSSNERAMDRVTDAVNSSLSFVTGSLDYDLDPTSKLRVEALGQSLQLLEENYLFGTGYNALQFRKLDKGFISSTGEHSSSGSDVSLLTIFLTTGIFGFGTFLFLLFKILQGSFLLFIKKHIPTYVRSLGLGIFASIIALTLHSFFVNSLLFPFILLTYIPVIAMLDTYILEYIDLQPLKNKVNKHP